MKAVYLKMSFVPFSSYLHAPKYPCYCCLDSDPYSSTQLPTIRLRRLTVGAVSKLRICISNPHALSFCHGRRAPSPSGTLARRRQPVQSRLPASRVSQLFLSIFFPLSKTPARTWPLHRLPRSLPARLTTWPFLSRVLLTRKQSQFGSNSRVNASPILSPFVDLSCSRDESCDVINIERTRTTFTVE